ncbi:MAG: IS66 family transposase [Bacteroides sp.]
MNDRVTDISKMLSEMNSKLSLMEQIISEQGAEISRLHRIINQKDKEIHILKKRLSKYEEPYKDSHNSSVPPSQESLAAKVIRRTQSLRKKSNRKNGGQFGHPGSTLETSTFPDFIEEHRSHYCECCGSSLTGADSVCTGVSQVVDIPLPRPQVKEHRSFNVTCSCGHINKCPLPKECSKRISYGNTIQSLVAFLSHVQCVSFERICEILKEIFSLSISQGTIRNMLIKIGNKSKVVCEKIRRRITKSKVVGADETGLYVNNVLDWAWIFQTNQITYLYQDKSRGMKAINKHFPDGLPNSILVTDRHGSYFNMEVQNHQVCIAHLLRNIQYLTELDLKQDWSKRMSTLFREAIHIRKTTSFELIPVTTIKDRLDRLLNESVAHLHEDFQKFKNGIFKCKDYLFTFLQNPDVPYDNNASERGIRKIKVKQKVSRCFRTEQGADTFMSVHSVAETAKKTVILNTKLFLLFLSSEKDQYAFIPE